MTILNLDPLITNKSILDQEKIIIEMKRELENKSKEIRQKKWNLLTPKEKKRETILFKLILFCGVFLWFNIFIAISSINPSFFIAFFTIAFITLFIAFLFIGILIISDHKIEQRIKVIKL